MNRNHLRKPLISLLVISLCASAPAWSSAQDEKAEADRAAIHAAVKTWSAAAQAKDLEAFAAVYAEDAIVMLEGAQDLRGIAAIREGIGGMMQDPNFDLSFEADKVVVAESGDLAYETGTYGLRVSDAEGNPVAQQGHYVVVWRKTPDGEWRVVIDAPVSGPPVSD